MNALAGNIAELLWRASDSVGECRLALLERNRSTTYPELQLNASGIAGELAAGGLQPGDRVGIFLERGPEAVAAFFGVLAAGGAVVFLNETLPARQIESMLAHSAARYVITSRDLLEQIPREIEPACRILVVEDLPADGCWEPVYRIGNDLAQIIYTAGCIGRPRGVALSHANLFAGVRAVTRYLGLAPNDRLASLLPFSFDYGQSQLLCAVDRGATLVVERSSVPKQIVQTLRSMEVTVLAAVPQLWHQLLHVTDFVERSIPSLRLLTNAGGQLSADAVKQLRRSQPQARICLMHGLTEAFRSTYLPPDELERRPGSIGLQIPGAEIMVLGDDLSPCEPGEVGELVHRGPTVALGYWRDTEATARVFRPNPLRPEGSPDAERVVFSGDLVRRDEQGFVYFVGHRNGVVKALGFRECPEELAAVLRSSGEVVEATVRSEPDSALGERIVAYVVLKADGSLDRLKNFADKELPALMRPAHYEAGDALPRASSTRHSVPAAAAAAGPV